jgi:proteic killer suppression protein
MAIRRFKHDGLERFFESGATTGIQVRHVVRLRQMLALLDAVERPGEMGLHGWSLHPLQGARRGTWAVKVSASWRLTFRFEGSDATDVDYEDYH